MIDKPEKQKPRYEVKQGKDGKFGIFSTEYNVRFATFVDNAYIEREEIAELLKGKIFKQKPVGEPRWPINPYNSFENPSKFDMFFDIASKFITAFHDWQAKQAAETCTWEYIKGVGYNTQCGYQHQRDIDVKGLYKGCPYCLKRIEVKEKQ